MENKLWSRREILALGGACGLPTVALLGARDGQAASRYRDLVLAKGPAGYWRLGEADGATARDETGNGHDGAYRGHVSYKEPGPIAGDADTAIKLDGSSAYVEVPDSDRFSQPADGKGLTVEAWVRPDILEFAGQTQEHYVHWLGKGEKGQFEWGFRFYSRNSSRPNRLSAYIWNPDGALGSGAYFQDNVQPGAWIHVVACFAPGDKNDAEAGVSIYKNGVLRGSPRTQKGALYSAYHIVPVHGSAPVRFGTRDLGSFLQGGLDEIAIYPRTLTGAEIADNYRAGSGP